MINSLFSSFPMFLRDVSKFAHLVSVIAVNLLLQTTLVLSIGLLATWLLRRRGAALQSCVLKMTLAATLLCPLFSLLLSAAGVSGLRVDFGSDAGELSHALLVSTESGSLPGQMEAGVNLTSEGGLPRSSSLPEGQLLVGATVVDEAPIESGDVLIPWSASSEGVSASSADTTATDATDLQVVLVNSPSKRTMVYLGVCGIWLLCSGLLLARMMVAIVMMERIRRRSWNASAEVQSDCQAIARQMSVKSPPVLINDRLSSPCLLGCFRPAVMLPAGLHPVSSDVLAHELAHLRRQDCFWNLLGHLTIACLPWQPLAWLLNRRLEETADNVCDDYVVAHNFDRVAYARELVTLAERFPSSWTNATTSVGIAEIRSSLGYRVQRILDGSRILSLRTESKNLFLVLAAALLGTVIAGFLGAARNDPGRMNQAVPGLAEPALAANAVGAALPNGEELPDEVFVTGLVLKPDGTPAVGATVRSSLPTFIQRHLELQGREVPAVKETQVDQEGRFSISVSTKPFGEQSRSMPPWLHWNGAPIVATLPGYGPAWIEYRSITPGQPLTLRLVEDLPIRGRVIDTEGKPVQNMVVNVDQFEGVEASDKEDLTEYLVEAAGGGGYRQGSPHAPRRIDTPLLLLPKRVVTDDDGTFEIRGLGKERIIHLAFDGGEVVYQKLTVATREMNTVIPKDKHVPGVIQRSVYGAQFEIALPRSRPIDGTVVDAKTGDLLPGVSVQSFQIADYGFGSFGVLKTESDSNGRFQLKGMPKAKGNWIVVCPVREQPYFIQHFEVPDPQGFDPVPMAITLHRGVWIKGRVTDQLTHEPVANASVDYSPYLTNPIAAKHPAFKANSSMNGMMHQTLTDADGKYQVVGLPGPGLISVDSHFVTYPRGMGYEKTKGAKDQRSGELLVYGKTQHGMPAPRPGPNWPTSMRDVELNGTEDVEIDLELHPGFTTALEIVDQDGKPVSDSAVSAEGTGSPPIKSEQYAGHSITVANLIEGKSRDVLIHHAARNLGCFLQLEPPYQQAMKAILSPCMTVTGRLIKDGEPLVNINITPEILPIADVNSRLMFVMTDATGRFQINLLPGAKYQLHAMGSGLPDFSATVVDEMEVDPGKTKDFGDLILGKDGKFLVAKVETRTTGKNDAELRRGELPAKEIQVAGTVLKPDGTPAAGATIRSAASVWAMIKSVLPEGFVPKMSESTADTSGKFSIAISTQPYGDLPKLDEQWLNLWKETVIAATLPGYGAAWIEYKNITAGAPLQLRLVEDLPIRGRIIDLEGKPIGGVGIKLSNASAAKDEDLSSWLAGIKAGEPPWTVYRLAPRRPELRLIGLPESVTTDQDGVLTIRGLGKDRTIDLTFEGERMAHRSATAVSRAIEPMKQVISQPPSAVDGPVFGAEFEFAVPPSRPIEGIVIDSETGLPLSGVSVESNKFADYPYSNHRVLKTTTDSSGRFRLVGMPKAAGNQILLVPNDDQPYFMRSMNVPDPQGIAAVEMRVELHRGIWIRGRVTDQSTREPVSGVRLHYLPFRTNEFAGRIPEFDKNGNTDGDQTRYVTDRNGNYRLVGLPGRAVVGAESVMKSYRTGVGFYEIDGPKDGRALLTWRNPLNPSPSWPSVMKEINPAPADEDIQLNLELDPGFSVKLRLLDSDQQPVAGVQITGYSSPYQAKEFPSEVASIVNLAADEERMVIAVHEERNIGWVTRLFPPYDKDREVTMELVPCATVSGRLLNDGEPLPGITIEPQFVQKSWGFLENLTAITTDSQGRFRGTFIPGADYELHAQGKGMRKRAFVVVADKLTVKPGEVKDLGDLMLGKDGKFVSALAKKSGD